MSGVPKFTSFRPKPTLKENAEPSREASRSDKSSREEHRSQHGSSELPEERSHRRLTERGERSSRPRSPERREKSSRHRSTERREKRSRHHSPEGKEKRSRHASPDRREKRLRRNSPDKDKISEESRQHLDVPQDSTPSKLYFIDRRGDFDIVRYGGINRYDVPSYRRSGYGCVLGVPSYRKIDRNLSTEKFIVLTSATKSSRDRLLTRKHAAKERHRSMRLIRQANENEDDLRKNFIAFSGSFQRRPEDHDEDGDNEPEFDYRGTGEATNEGPDDPDAEYEPEDGLDSVDKEAIVLNSTLVRKTKDNPENLQAWLDFVEHQEVMMKADHRSGGSRGTNKHHLAEIRISIYEEALRKIGNNQDNQIKLYSNLMDEAARAWSETQLASKWTEILGKYPFTTELWIKYLDFVQSSFTNFRYENCKDTIQKCLQVIQSSATPVSVDFHLYLINRLTFMIHQAGYQELALAIWQALLEYYFMAPEEPSQSIDESMTKFEKFWDSEVPRLGEHSAKGWRSSSLDDVPSGSGPADPVAEPDLSEHLLDQFQKQEIDCMVRLRFPGRTVDENGDDDPFHTIFFSDIEPFLKLASHAPVPILSSFLRFCQLPPLLRDDTYSDKHVLDPFLQDELPDTSPTTTDRPHKPSDSNNGFDDLVLTYSKCSIRRFQSTTELLFDQSFPATGTVVDIAFVRRVLKMLANSATDGELIGEYFLAFELNYFPDEAFKTAKQLLKARPTSLRLYNACGLVESRRGNSTKADQVFSAALSMQNPDALLSGQSELQLFYNWTWEALRRGDPQESLKRLLSPSGKVSASSSEGPDQAGLLRARRLLTETKERALLSSDLFVATISTSLLALLAYLASNSNPDAALKAFAQLTTWFTTHSKTHSPPAELHAQYTAQLLAYHAGHAAIVKPSLLRSSLEPLLATFPNNTLLLSIYAANEARFSINDRVRAILAEKILVSDAHRSILGWAFAIHHERLRGEIAGSTVHSIRALYAKAEDDVGAHCPLLWKQHVRFEIAEAKKERAKRPRRKPRRDGKASKEDVRAEEAVKRVRDVFFKGLTALPWCKGYMMMAFTHLGRDFLSEEDLRKVYDVMVEKELRLYIDLEELGDGVSG